MKSRRARIVLAACVAAGAASGAALVDCFPAYTFGSGTSPDGGEDATVTDGGPGTDGTVPGDSASDAPSTDGADSAGQDVQATDSGFDAGPGGDGGTFTVASAGARVFSTGYGYQQHVVYAQADARYWLFYAGATGGVIETTTSPDLVTWTANASIALPSGYDVADGYNFSVAYASIGGKDVVHIVADVANGNFEAVDIRATIAGGTISATATDPLPDTGNGGSCTNDGPMATIDSSGYVWDVTAWTGHPNTGCDTDIYQSPSPDVGFWDGGVFSYQGYFVSIPSYTYCHGLWSLPEAGVVLAVWPDQDNSAVNLFDSFGWALSPSFVVNGDAGYAPPATDELFNGTGAVSSVDDWATCRLTDSDVHVVRHVLVGTSGTSVSAFEDLEFDGSAWTAVGAPAAVSGTSNTGLALLSDENPADGMLAAAIGTDDAIHVSKLTGTGWSQVATIPGTAPRQSLAGTGCGSRRPALFWTEGTGSPYSIVTVDVSGLL